MSECTNQQKNNERKATDRFAVDAYVLSVGTGTFWNRKKIKELCSRKDITADLEPLFLEDYLYRSILYGAAKL